MSTMAKLASLDFGLAQIPAGYRVWTRDRDGVRFEVNLTDGIAAVTLFVIRGVPGVVEDMGGVVLHSPDNTGECDVLNGGCRPDISYRAFDTFYPFIHTGRVNAIVRELAAWHTARLV